MKDKINKVENLDNEIDTFGKHMRVLSSNLMNQGKKIMEKNPQ